MAEDYEFMPLGEPIKYCKHNIPVGDFCSHCRITAVEAQLAEAHQMLSVCWSWCEHDLQLATPLFADKVRAALDAAREVK